jgi:hypothetical protein
MTKSSILVLSALALLPAPLRADKLDKESKAWFESVRALLTPEEEKTFNSLKGKGDRDEFAKIFWARRNPQGPDKEPNDFKVSFEKEDPGRRRPALQGGGTGGLRDRLRPHAPAHG